MAENFEGEVIGFPQEIILNTEETENPNYVVSVNGEQGAVIVTPGDSANTVHYTAQTPTSGEQAIARTNIGLGTSDVPQFAGLGIGSAGSVATLNVEAGLFTVDLAGGLGTIGDLLADGTIFSIDSPGGARIDITNATITGYTISNISGVSPGATAGCKLWLEADTINGINASTVNTWEDASAEGNDATRTAGTPQYITDALGGQPGVLFNGGDHLATGTFLSSSYNTNITVICLYTNSAATQGTTGVPWSSSTGGQPTSGFFHGARGWSSGGYYFGGAGSITPSNAQPVNTPLCDVYRYDGAHMMVRHNGQNLEPIVATAAIGFTSANVCIGRGINTGVGWDHQGYIFQLAVFNRVLSDDEVEEIEQYFRYKYKILNRPRLIFVGDSLFGETAPNTVNPPQLVMQGIGGLYNYDAIILAHASYTMTGWGEIYGELIDDCVPATGEVLVFLELGVNDLKETVPDTSAAALLALYQAFATNRKAAGVSKVFFHTITASSAAGQIGTFETKRQTFNADVLSTYSSYADGVVDAGSSVIGDEAESLLTNYFLADHIHLNDAGAQVMANLQREIAEGFLGSSQLTPLAVARGGTGLTSLATFLRDSQTLTLTGATVVDVTTAALIFSSGGNQVATIATTAASTPALSLSRTPFSGTGTTSFPLVYINDANATPSTTLNTAGTYFGVNGDGAQDLMNLLKDGTSQFKVGSTVTMAGGGNVQIAPTGGAVVDISPTAGNVTITPGGSGTVTITSAASGNINGMNIGATTRGTGAFTTLAANSTGQITGTLTLGDGTAATAILASNLSGATDPTITFSNAQVLVSGPLSVNGATIGSNALAVTGTSNFSTTITVGNGSFAQTRLTLSNQAGVTDSRITQSGNGGFIFDSAGGTNSFILVAPGTAIMQQGAADAATAVAQTLRVQSIVAGTADVAGQNWTQIGSKSTGSAASGDIIFQVGGKGAASTTQNTVQTAVTIKAATTNNTDVGRPSFVIGNSALATNATDGFLYIPTCAGTPTGTPTAVTGRVALVYDTTNKQFWIYDGGWLQPKTPAGAALVTWQ